MNLTIVRWKGNNAMDAKDLIKKYEALKLEAYLCPAGIPTIGWGHTFNVKLGQRISKNQAQIFFEDDYAEAEQAVKEQITVPLTVNQLGALTSFVFNLGPRNLLGSTLRKKLNQGDYKGAALEFEKWVYASREKLNGLIARRADERKLFERNDNASS